MKILGSKLFVCFLICLSAQVSNAQSPKSSGRAAKPIAYGVGRAGVLFDVGIYYGQSEATANPVSSNEYKTNVSIYDVKLGYIFNEGYFLGGEYSTRNESSTATTTATLNGGGAGVGLGYFSSGGFYLRGYYRFNETFGDYKNGTGYQADLGYMMNLTSNFFVGIAFTNRQITFKENALILGFDSWIKKDTYPFLTLGFVIN
ncbi:MAG: hypothetical protein H7061_00310 [Bdellovibrionaceae bacterium]|nr:hypothetical protein [Bdellovibrio sp.]